MTCSNFLAHCSSFYLNKFTHSQCECTAKKETLRLTEAKWKQLWTPHLISSFLRQLCFNYYLWRSAEKRSNNEMLRVCGRFSDIFLEIFSKSGFLTKWWMVFQMRMTDVFMFLFLALQIPLFILLRCASFDRCASVARKSLSDLTRSRSFNAAIGISLCVFALWLRRTLPDTRFNKVLPVPRLPLPPRFTAFAWSGDTLDGGVTDTGAGTAGTAAAGTPTAAAELQAKVGSQICSALLLKIWQIGDRKPPDCDLCFW